MLIAAVAFVFMLPAFAQYPGQVAKPDANAPDLRSVAVYEWTGDEAHPKAARMVPVCVYDGQDLNDAGVYLAHPEPLALESDVEYQLQRDGKPVGLFDIDTSAREQGGWVGYGKWRSLPAASTAPAQVAKVDEEDDAQSDVPILHRKHHADDSGGGTSSGSGSGSSGPAPDPDRPTLHKSGDGRLRIQARTPAVTAHRPPTHQAVAHRRMIPAVRSSKRKRRRTKRPTWQMLPVPPIRTVRASFPANLRVTARPLFQPSSAFRSI